MIENDLKDHDYTSGSSGIAKLLPADQLDLDIQTNEVPPEGEAMPPGAVFDISLMNRKERRIFKKNHAIKIVGNNIPFVKTVAKHEDVV